MPTLSFTDRANSVEVSTDQDDSINFLRGGDLDLKAINASQFVFEGIVYTVPAWTVVINAVPVVGNAFVITRAIDDLFPNEGGGSSTPGGRFGVAGEDDVAAQSRNFDADENGLSISNVDYFTVDTVDPLGTGGVVSQTLGREASWAWRDQTADNYARVFAGKTGTGAVPTAYIEAEDYVNDKKNGVYVDRDGISLTLQSFDNNADAVAALGVGKLYKSSSLSVEGSPLILITV